MKSRREFEEQIKALVGEDKDEHSFNGVMHWDYLTAARSGEALKIEGDHIGVVVAVGRDSRRRAAAGHDRLRFHFAAATRCAL